MMGESAEINSEIQPKTQDKYEVNWDHQICQTIQGGIFYGYHKKTGNKIVVKRAAKLLVKNRKSIGNEWVHENFLKEMMIHYKISNMNNITDYIVKILDEWEDDIFYYCAIEYCDMGLFNYVKDGWSDKAHPMKSLVNYNGEQYMSAQKPSKWYRKMQMYFAQLMLSVGWMHINGICHMDLSLENTMINKVKINSNNGKHPVFDNLSEFPLDNYNVLKIIDFGMALDFSGKKNFICSTEKLGKTYYMAPEVYNGDDYDARAADLWSCGIMLFMMLCGCPPFRQPSNSKVFELIVSGKTDFVLKKWKRLGCITKCGLDLLNKILTYEKKRINMLGIFRHKFFREGFRMLTVKDIKQKKVIIRRLKEIYNNNGNDKMLSKTQKHLLINGFIFEILNDRNNVPNCVNTLIGQLCYNHFDRKTKKQHTFKEY